MSIWLKALIAFAIGLLFGFLFKVFYRRRIGTPFEVATPQQVSVDGVLVNFIQAGRGPDLLMIHGIGASIFCWRFVFRSLSRHFRVTVIDLPGFGASDKNPRLDYGLDAQVDRVARLIELLDLQPCHLLGCSMGGSISLWLAKKYPALIEKVCVISPAAHRKVVKLNTRPLFGFVSLVGVRFATPYIIEKIYKLVVARQELVTTSNVNEYYRPFAGSSDAVKCFWKAHETLRDPRLPSELQFVTKDVLILYGERDRLVPRWITDEIAQALGEAKLVLHPSAGHHLMEDDPDFVTEQVSDFFGSTKALT